MTDTAVREIWYTRCPVPTTSGLAHHFGFLSRALAAEGIRVDTVLDSPDFEVRRSHFTHTLPNSFREGGNVPALWAQAQNGHTVVVGISWIDEEQLILVRPDSDITTLQHLKGRRLGIPRHSTVLVDYMRAQDQHGLVTALRLGGLLPEDAQFIDVAGHDYEERASDGSRKVFRLEVADALAEGSVDAIYAKGVTSAELVAKRGFRPLLDINAHPDPFVRVNTGTPRPVTVNADLARRRPDIVARYLATLLKTSAWAKSNPDAIAEAVACETDSVVDHVRVGYGSDLHLHFDITLSDVAVEGLRQ